MDVEVEAQVDSLLAPLPEVRPLLPSIARARRRRV
jgi:hypothetical protein